MQLPSVPHVTEAKSSWPVVHYQSNTAAEKSQIWEVPVYYPTKPRSHVHQRSSMHAKADVKLA